MSDALIGFTGFVGSSLMRQRSFEHLYRSTNIGEIRNRRFDTVVCAGAPAQKWLANKDPVTDLASINNLIDNLSTIQCDKFILISTIDIFLDPTAVDESSEVVEKDLHPYGLHRRLLEKFVEEHFPNHLILRLPGLVGPGLRKNVIYDLVNENNVHLIESRSVFQFYPTVNLWFDLQVALSNEIRLLHLTSEPVSVADIAKNAFNMSFSQTQNNKVASYDMRSIHAEVFGGDAMYQYSRRDVFQATRAYVQSELVFRERSAPNKENRVENTKLE